MATDFAQAGTLLGHLCQLVAARAASASSDAELLERFLASREEAAFAALVERHARLVWSVCRHVLHQEQDIEDAFQATFLLLACKAGSIRKGEAIGSFLHGVAYRIAMTTRRSAQRRRSHESKARLHAGESINRSRVHEEPACAATLGELQAILHDEVQRLPEKYRGPFVLCCLEGKTKAEAAQELGCKEGTLSSRLARARERLQERLKKRGVALSAVLCAGAVTADATTAPVSLIAGTLQTVLHPATVSAAAARVAALLREASGVLWTRLTLGVVLLLALSALATGAAFLAHAPEDRSPPAQPDALPRNPTEARTDRVGDALPPGALARLGSVRLRMGGSALSVAFSPDGKHLAAAGQEPMVHVWETASGKEVALLKGHQGYVTAVRFFPDGKQLATAGHDGTVRVWDLATQREKLSLATQGTRVQSLAVTPDGKSVVVGYLDRTVRRWDLATGKKDWESTSVNNGSVDLLALTGDGKNVAWGSTTQGLHIDDLATGKPVHVISPKRSMVQGLACSSDGKFVAWAGQPPGIRVVDVATGKEVLEIARTLGNIRALAFSPDGKFLAASGYDLKVRTWEVASGKEVTTMEGSAGYLMTVAYSPDGKHLAAVGPYSLVPVWDAASGKLLHEVSGHTAAVQAVTFTPDGTGLLSGGADGTVRLWDPKTGKENSEFQAVHGGPVAGLAVTPDGKTLYSAGIDQAILAWSLAPTLPGEAARAPLRRFAGIPWPGHELEMALSPSGKLVAATDNRAAAYFWDASTATEAQPLPLPKEPRRGVAFAPDGRTVALRTREGILELWDLTSGKEKQRIGAKEHSGPFAFSPDGRAILALDRDLHLWEVATGRERWRVAVTQEFLPCLAFSPTGKLCALGGTDTVIRILDTRTGQEVARLAGHLGAIRALAFSPDGRRLVSGSVDTTALVWDASRLEQAAERPTKELKADRLEALWQALLGGGTAQAYQAVGDLANSPQEAVPFLKTRLSEVSWPDPKEVPRLLADLDSDQFNVRENASAALEELGEVAEPLLRKALEGVPSTEVRVRVGALLVERKDHGLPAKKVRVVRALEVLEQVGTAEARAVIEGLAMVKEPDWLRQEAEATLERWARRARVAP
jgi:RNA polymerase sigma factor (sigma-70 family)